MIQRILAALIGLAILLPAIIWGGIVAVDVIVGIVIVICLDEYTRMAFPGDQRAAMAWQVLGCGALYGAALGLGDRWIGLVAVLLVLATLVFVLFRPPPQIEEATDRVARHLLAFGWIGGCFTSMALLRRLDDGLVWIFLLLSLAWVADTGAYFAGRFFGRTKFYELISPKKTWEGFFGGIILTTIGVFVVRAVALSSLTALDAVVIGVCLGTAGAVGDLVESMIKRAFHVKDSGWLMPGHGGLLDRVDAVLFIAPLLYGYAVLIKGY